MAETSGGPQIVKQWFDGLERQLAEEAKQAGLLRHGTMIGNAREFFVRRVLQSFLPSSVRIGTGRVIGVHSPTSKQTDIVIFDGRFPSFQMPDGQSLFPVEGVIATIEVKSRLDTAKLHESLDACLSVARVSPSVVSEELKSQAKRFEETPSGIICELPEELERMVIPRTYVFAFDGFERPEDLNEAVNEWLIARGHPSTPNRMLLPSIIVTGGAVAVLYGDPIRISDLQMGTRDGKEVDPTNVQIFMFVFKAERKFGWLATHLLYAIETRRFEQDSASPLRMALGNYFPFQEYFDEHAPDERRCTISRFIAN